MMLELIYSCLILQIVVGEQEFSSEQVVFKPISKRDVNSKSYQYTAGSCANCNCFKWTNWLNADKPTETGDWETLSFPDDMGIPGTINREHSMRVCTMPASVNCHAQTSRNISWVHADDHLYIPCNKRLGLVCLNKDQKHYGACRDYALKFLCWDECQYLKWSRWFNNDSPDGEGDFEILGHTIPANDWPCPYGSTPLDVQCATVSGLPIYQSKKKGLQCDLLGFSCKNELQGEDCKCDDFKVRFLCPAGDLPTGYKSPSDY